MYDLKLKNGDISLYGDTVETVSGREMIAQELSTWLQEPLGADKFNKWFGSSLSDYIGTPIYDEFVDEIETEVYRVVNSFVLYYRKKYEADMLDGIQRYFPGDVISSVDSIDIVEKANTVVITIVLSTFSGRVVINKELT